MSEKRRQKKKWINKRKVDAKKLVVVVGGGKDVPYSAMCLALTFIFSANIPLNSVQFPA